ncbi:hypothetical protein J8J27_21680, partial [Mycobacterium tuberculosis]|nr:hypothetical protein [Mycobacterium tuberculosis]
MGSRAEVLDLQDLGRLGDARLDLRLRRPRRLQRERHVLVDVHVRVERVGLEHHGDAALRRRHGVHRLALDLQDAGADLFQP